jgi:hypothetical protein
MPMAQCVRSCSTTRWVVVTHLSTAELRAWPVNWGQGVGHWRTLRFACSQVYIFESILLWADQLMRKWRPNRGLASPAFVFSADRLSQRGTDAIGLAAARGPAFSFDSHSTNVAQAVSVPRCKRPTLAGPAAMPRRRRPFDPRRLRWSQLSVGSDWGLRWREGCVLLKAPHGSDTVFFR